MSLAIVNMYTGNYWKAVGSPSLEDGPAPVKEAGMHS